jgi:hypothetical protein
LNRHLANIDLNWNSHTSSKTITRQKKKKKKSNSYQSEHVGMLGYGVCFISLATPKGLSSRDRDFEKRQTLELLMLPSSNPSHDRLSLAGFTVVLSPTSAL